MDSDTLRFHIIARVSAIALSLYLLFYLSSNNAFSITLVLVALLIIVQVVALIRFLDRTNREIMSFFEAIKNGDLNRPLPDTHSGTYDQYLRQQC